ncbi:CDGSH iron-sulfur domain-containing protein [Candidatus Woesearchaeota archaeon]|nr:CDGSH iron-sulfur domain-containing protein [Candidatus Woesearchaeota archaeon]
MARIVRHDAKAPVEVKLGDKSAYICMCGLSKKKPYCDGSHRITAAEEEGKLFVYGSDGNKIEIVKQD